MRHPLLKRNNVTPGCSIHYPVHPVKKDANIFA